MFPLDQELFNFFYSWTGHFKFLDWIFIFSARYLFWVVLFWTLWLLFRKTDWKNDLAAWKNRFQVFAMGFLAFLLSRGVVANIIDTTLQNPRPFAALDIISLIPHADVNSFPSGHMASMTPIVFTLFLINRKAGWWGVFALALVGLGRIITGVHWPSDILGGIFVGVISSYLIYWFFKKRKIV